LARKICHSAAAFKAWSQNNGQKNKLTTLTNYGAVPAAKQAESIRGFEPGKLASEEVRIATIVAATMRQLKQSG